MVDYRNSQSDYMVRVTNSNWEPVFSLGLGSRPDLKDLPVPRSLEFSILYGQVGG